MADLPMPDGRPPDPDGRVAVVIATRDRESSLRRTLSRLGDLPESPVVYVVDNDSRDGTVRMVLQEFPGVTVVPLPRNLGAAARNHGARLARTPYVAFCDDDSWWAPGALRQAADTLDRCPRLAVVAARTLVGDDGRTDPTSTLMARSPLRCAPGTGGPGVLGFLACSAVVRRTAFLAVGGFCELLLIGGEERLLAYDLAAAGWELAYLDQVVAVHHPGDRDGSARSLLVRRNDLLIEAMRRPWPAALGAFLGAARRGLRDREEFRALAAAAGAVPQALRGRREVPQAVEAAIRRLAVAESARRGTDQG